MHRPEESGPANGRSNRRTSAKPRAVHSVEASNDRLSVLQLGEGP